MIGTHEDAVVAHAVVKHIAGFDLYDAYASIRKGAFVAPPRNSSVGRVGLQDYIDKGYVPEGHAGYFLSSTLD